MGRYITIDEVIKRLGDAQALQLTTSTSKGEIDEEKIEKQIGRAEDEIDSYCSKRYETPFSIVPELIKTYAFNLTHYYLKVDKSGANEWTDKENKQLMLELREIAKGNKNIPGVSGKKAAVNTNQLPRFKTSPRIFGRDKLGAY